MSQYRLVQIDELKRSAHSYLREGDYCLYLMEYFSHMTYTYSHENDLIQNLKKPVNRKGKYEYKYKTQAIQEATEHFRTSVIPAINTWGECSLVPIPCSKAKSDPLYDDRVEQFASKCLSGSNANFVELIRLKNSRPSAHENPDKRLRPEEHMELLEIDTSQVTKLKDTIILVDDVITTGAQFVACKELILQIFPDKIFTGIFLARRNVVPPQIAFQDL